jgi:hypothetical protein
MHRIRIRPARWGVALTVLGATAMSVALLAPVLVQSPTRIPGVLLLNAPAAALPGAPTVGSPGGSLTTPDIFAGVGALPSSAPKSPSPRVSGASSTANPARTAHVSPGTAVTSGPRAATAPTPGRPATGAATQPAGPTPGSVPSPTPTSAVPTAPSASTQPAPVTVVTPDRPVVRGGDDGSDDSWEKDRSTLHSGYPQPTSSHTWGADG